MEKYERVVILMEEDEYLAFETFKEIVGVYGHQDAWNIIKAFVILEMKEFYTFLFSDVEFMKRINKRRNNLGYRYSIQIYTKDFDKLLLDSIKDTVKQKINVELKYSVIVKLMIAYILYKKVRVDLYGKNR